jgi:hypothetical protein
VQRTSLVLGFIVAAALCSCNGPSKKQAAPSTPTSASAASAAARPATSSANAGGTALQPSTATPVPDPAIDARLHGALLALADMPPGWTTTDPSPDGGATSADFCGVPSVESQELGKAEADFQGGQLGPFFTEELAQIKPGVAKSQLDALAQALPGCQPQTETQDDGSALTYTVSPLAFPTLGEQTVAVRLKVDGSLLPIQGDAVFIRRANSVAIVALLAVGLAGPDEALTEMLARRVDARFAAVAR